MKFDINCYWISRNAKLNLFLYAWIESTRIVFFKAQAHWHMDIKKNTGIMNDFDLSRVVILMIFPRRDRIFTYQTNFFSFFSRMSITLRIKDSL